MVNVRMAERGEVRDAYDHVLAPSFPFDELEPFEQFATQLDEGRSELRIALDENEIVAAAVTKDLPPSGAVLLSQMATREGRRGAGLGTRLYRALLGRIVDELQPSLVLAEMEHPDYHEAHPLHGDPLARLRFYGRFDARLIDVPYFQASLGPGLQPVYGLLLLALYVRPDLINPARTPAGQPGEPVGGDPHHARIGRRTRRRLGGAAAHRRLAGPRPVGAGRGVPPGGARPQARDLAERAIRSQRVARRRRRSPAPGCLGP